MQAGSYYGQNVLVLTINGDFHERLAVIFIHDAFNLDGDPLRISDEFNRLGITLFIIANRIFTFENWNFYYELARNTGGDYALLEHAPIVLTDVISSVLTGENTLRQAFHHRHIENLPIVVNNIEEENEIIDNVQELNFDDGFAS
ncbi:unnamed protein product [Rotaria sordida]|uniref:Uncharacterized protein n=2 Tax=Rotaria sordida TaxID=392033 RepID=A0A820C5A6_9BILA|nr:unnamed protein product [Rotaria sordida]